MNSSSRVQTSFTGLPAAFDIGLPTNFKILGSVSDSALFSSSDIFLVSLIIVSCISLTYFVNHFLNLSILTFSKEEFDKSSPEVAIDHDLCDSAFNIHVDLQ